MAGPISLARAFSGALLLIAPLAVRATPVCGGSTFTTCASVSVTKVLLANGNVRVRIDIRNEAGLAGTHDGTRVTYIGLWGIPETARYVDSSLVVGGTAVSTDWRLAQRSREDDEAQKKDFTLREDMRGVRLRPGVIEGLRAGEQASFEFDLSGVSFDDVNVRDWELHAEAGGGECSTTMVARNGTMSEARNEAALCSAVATPEPATFALFATGLLGIGMVWRSRRRR